MEYLKLELTEHCVWRGPHSSSQGKASCTPPPPPLAGPQWIRLTTHLE